jgi:predicted DNA-binding transcriptional regulator AlpA
MRKATRKVVGTVVLDVPVARSDRWLSARQVMDRYGISRTTLNAWLRDEGFPALAKYIGNRRRWRAADLDAWDVETAKPREVA